jgi:hypothetical protein
MGDGSSPRGQPWDVTLPQPGQAHHLCFTVSRLPRDKSFLLQEGSFDLFRTIEVRDIAMNPKVYGNGSQQKKGSNYISAAVRRNHCSPAPLVLVEVFLNSYQVKYYATQSFIIMSVAVFQHLFTKVYNVRETQPNQSN